MSSVDVEPSRERIMERGEAGRASDDFYSRLTALGDFAAVARLEHFRPLPGDWSVAVADVAGSTGAIAGGRYRDVNLVGASAIAAVLNATKPLDLPYIFGGDGATVCLPSHATRAAAKALRGAQRMAKEEFGLKLRCGILSCEEIQRSGQTVGVAKVQVSESYTQAAFGGGGVSWAEQQVKERGVGGSVMLGAEGGRGTVAGGDEEGAADFSGLECRWNPIMREGREFVSLLVKAVGDAEQRARVYDEVIGTIGRIYRQEREERAVSADSLRLTLLPKSLYKEVKVQKNRGAGVARLLACARVWLETAAGVFFMRAGIRAVGVNWGEYRRDVVRNTDSRKFDDLLREVRGGSAEQTKRLREYLEEKTREGGLEYGMHVSDSALMTCLIFQRGGGHVHFVDGADGGYAAAAAEMKKKLEGRGERPTESGQPRIAPRAR